jgi:hypothetical protein
VWEAGLLAHARRAAVLREEHRVRVFHSSNPQSVNTFLVDGVVAGTWRHDGRRVVTEPFAALSGPAARALRDEADRLAELYR